jgi:hypothetical protein
LAAESQNE